MTDVDTVLKIVLGNGQKTKYVLCTNTFLRTNGIKQHYRKHNSILFLYNIESTIVTYQFRIQSRMLINKASTSVHKTAKSSIMFFM